MKLLVKKREKLPNEILNQSMLSLIQKVLKQLLLVSKKEAIAARKSKDARDILSLMQWEIWFRLSFMQPISIIPKADHPKSFRSELSRPTLRLCILFHNS